MRLIIRGLRYRHAAGGTEVLKGIDLDIGPGEAVAVVGPSGSGKTTFLALLGGLLPTQSGQISFVDEHDQQWNPFDCAAWVLQTVNVLGDRTVVDNVCLGGYAAGQDRITAVADARRWLGVVGLAGRADDPVRVLSGGEIQRVVIARALATGRPVLLADEPTGQLDAQTTDSVLSALIDPSRARTLIIVTHDDTVANRCDRVMRLHNGTLC
jgi:putative ABC transport system ATP-binding protein/lipoprotein-releasing system ATP-binding protein